MNYYNKTNGRICREDNRRILFTSRYSWVENGNLQIQVADCRLQFEIIEETEKTIKLGKMKCARELGVLI